MSHKFLHWLFLLMFVILNLTKSSTASESVPAADIKYPIYALNYASNSISKIDGETDRIINTIKLPDVASTFSIASDGNIIAAITGVGDILAPYKSEIHIIDPTGNPISSFTLKYIPDNMYINNTNIGIVIHNTIIPGRIIPFTIIDFKDRNVLSTFKLQEFIVGVEFQLTTLLLYVIDNDVKSAKILKIDLDKNTITNFMELTDKQLFGRPIFYNGKLYGIRGRKGASMENNQTLIVIDLDKKRVEKILPLQDNPYALAFIEDKIYITHFNDAKPSEPDNKVSIINAKTYKLEKTLDVGRGPAGICYSKKLGKVYTANFWDGSVSVIDAKSEKVIKTIPTQQKFTNLIRCPN